MKKKIGDLTDKEKKAICEKAQNDTPILHSLYTNLSACNMMCPLSTKTGFCKAKRDVFNEEEIEVETDEK